MIANRDHLSRQEEADMLTIELLTAPG